MSQTIALHGGPMHGQQVMVPHNGDTFHVIRPDPRGWAMFSGEEPSVEVSTQLGTYSRVGKTQDFEWDGWAQE